MIGSPIAMRALVRGEDYMTDPLREPLRSLVEKEQRIVLLGTGSPQVEYAIASFARAPTAAQTKAARARTKFGLHVEGGRVSVRDGYDPMRWEPRTPHGQTFDMRDGYYAVHALWIDARDANMVIALCFEPRTRRLAGNGWPYLPCRVSVRRASF